MLISNWRAQLPVWRLRLRDQSQRKEIFPSWDPNWNQWRRWFPRRRQKSEGLLNNSVKMMEIWAFNTVRFNLWRKSSKKPKEQQENSRWNSQPDTAAKPALEAEPNAMLLVATVASMKVVLALEKYKLFTRQHQLEASLRRKKRTMWLRCLSMKARSTDSRRTWWTLLAEQILMSTLSKEGILNLAIPVLIFDQPLHLIVKYGKIYQNSSSSISEFQGSMVSGVSL